MCNDLVSEVAASVEKDLMYFVVGMAWDGALVVVKSNLVGDVCIPVGSEGFPTDADSL